MAYVLVVEDYEPSRKLLVRWLEREGYRVQSAGDGATAVALAAAHRFDLIMMDFNLPVLDGWEAIRQIRAQEAPPPVPILAMTASTAGGILSAARDAGCTAFVAKPVDFVQLRAELKQLLAARTG